MRDRLIRRSLRTCRRMEARAREWTCQSGSELTATVANSALPPMARRDAAQALQVLGHKGAYRPLLDDFAASAEGERFHEGTALAGFRLLDPDIDRLVRILEGDGHWIKRAAAARALAGQPNRKARNALICVLEDGRQPAELRGEVAEALGHAGLNRRVARVLRRLLHDHDPAIPFWAVFALGTLVQFRKGRQPLKALEALRPMVDDTAIAPGWWSVGREAQAMIEDVWPGTPEERELQQAQKRAILEDPGASKEEKRWAECYLD